MQGESICRGELTQATADKDLDALNLHLQKASELGLAGPEVEKAKALQKELLISHASLKALRYAPLALVFGSTPLQLLVLPRFFFAGLCRQSIVGTSSAILIYLPTKGISS